MPWGAQMDQRMDWKASEGGWLLEGAIVLVRKQQGLEGSEALAVGLHPENSYCWESLLWDLTPNPPPETLTLLPGPHLRRGLSGGPGTSFLLPNPKRKSPPHPPPNRLPGTSGPALLAHPLSLIANISHLFQPSPHWSICWVTQHPLGQACVGWLESLPPSPPNPPRSPGLVWFSRLGGRAPSLPSA